MRILIDECVPRKIKWSFPEHDCDTAQEAGWGGRQNGDLLTLAEGKFDVFLTEDKGLRYQQNLFRQVHRCSYHPRKVERYR